jgi:hypothetical protein
MTSPTAANLRTGPDDETAVFPSFGRPQPIAALPLGRVAVPCKPPDRARPDALRHTRTLFLTTARHKHY